MPITWIPIRGRGYWSKGKLIGEGQYINENDSLMERGTFNQDGKLDSANCEVVNYSDTSNVNIRIGQYSNGQENGQIKEYVFSKFYWSDFLNNSSISSTRYTHIFNHGTWVSTSDTSNSIHVLGNFTKNNNKWSGFSIEEA